MKISLRVDDVTNSVEFDDSNVAFDRVLGAVDRLLRHTFPAKMRHKALNLSRDTTIPPISDIRHHDEHCVTAYTYTSPPVVGVYRGPTEQEQPSIPIPPVDTRLHNTGELNPNYASLTPNDLF